MATQITYKHEDGRRISIFYPVKAAPFVPQSCYAFGDRKLVEVCQHINDTSESAFDTLLSFGGKGDEYAACAAAGLVHTLVRDLGFTRITSKPN